uniref:Membrane-spanning 4-domains subfamily A member 4A-like n=1 Tax=Astyanax mexicanus TaxID=7994 RepID=W5L945_ASTMX
MVIYITTATSICLSVCSTDRVQPAVRMSGPAVPLTNVGNGYTIVTHVFSPQTGTSETQQNVSSGGSLKKFLKGEPKALGTVQIMIGLLMFLFGIVISTNAQPAITVYSGISFWGSLLFIVTGSLAVSASNKLHRCVVNGALTMNVFSTITAAIAIILLFMDLVFSHPCYYDYDYGYGSRYRCSSRIILYLNYDFFCPLFRNQSNGIAGVLLVFCVLQFIISIFIAAHSCRASCNTEPTVGIKNKCILMFKGATVLSVKVFIGYQHPNVKREQ